jgi:hypothetical protein
MTGPNRAGRRNWPKRRQWLDRIAGDHRLTSGAKVWLMLLGRRSDDAGKPVWGNQEKMGAQLGRCSRSVRRYLVEAEELGYVKCFRSTPERDPGTGRWYRRKSNAYYLAIPAKDTAAVGAPRRRQRAGYCVIRPGRHHPPVLPDSHGPSSPLPGEQTAAQPAASVFQPAEHPQPAWTGEMSATVLDAIASAKARLGASQVGVGHRKRSSPPHPALLNQ